MPLTHSSQRAISDHPQQSSSRLCDIVRAVNAGGVFSIKADTAIATAVAAAAAAAAITDSGVESIAEDPR